MIVCRNCYGNEIEERVWIDLVTGDAVSREGEYFCRSCQSLTDIIVTADPEIWVEDVEPIKEENEVSIISTTPLDKRNSDLEDGES